MIIRSGQCYVRNEKREELGALPEKDFSEA
jgi:hypothetical protein